RAEALTAAAVEAAQRIDPGDAYVWVACESTVARSMRSALLAARPFNPKWMKVAGYWRLGRAGSHEVIED
ncbi:SIP domain-containing protein, partial [uncultured Brevundimonas sp.]